MKLAILILSLMFAGCASAPVHSEAPVFEAIRSTPFEEPLEGSYRLGAERLRAGTPEKEADAVFKQYGRYLIDICGLVCQPPLKDSKNFSRIRSFKNVTVPAITDDKQEGQGDYETAAYDFATRFNERMLTHVPKK